MDESLLPIVLTLAVTWSAIWDLRVKKMRPKTYLIRAKLEARISILRESSRFANAVTVIDTIVETI